jgi:hypothetical protein
VTHSSSKKNNRRYAGFFRAIRAALLLSGTVSLFACVASVDGDEASPKTEALVSEPVAEAEDALEGDGCNAFTGCSTGLTCCITQPQYLIGVCRNLNTDEQNCGACGDTCLGSQTCTNGHCCPSGKTYCAGEGCVDLKNDPDNCGGCGHECPFYMPWCLLGTCTDNP